MDTLTIPKYMFNGSPYAPDPKVGFTGTKIKFLIQKRSFYKKHREDTIKYLLSVYPTASESFEKLGPLELASFYNSLTYYYNCQYEYNLDNLSPEKRWDSLSCKDKYPLPYPPQGWFYSFYTFHNYNEPIVYSDSNKDNPRLNLKNFGSCRPGKGFDYISEKDRAGPGNFYFNCRSIHRDVTYPNGLTYVKNGKFNDWKKEWSFFTDMYISWNYPKNWVDGLSSGEYIEVTHTQPQPGLPQSLGWWWNGVVGSGLFLNLGKTIKANNKIDALYKLLELIKVKDNSFLLKWFKTDDIYQIIFGIIGTCGRDNNYIDKRYLDPSLHCEPDYLGILKISKLPVKNFYKETVRYQKQFDISNSEIPTQEGIIAAIDAGRSNKDYRLARVSTKILLDEPIFFTGLQLDLDTIQIPTDPNMNGNYVWEIIDLRMPEEYISSAKNRDYSLFLDINKDPSLNTYKPEALKRWMENIYQKDIITVRDPLDIYNNNKVEKCEGFYRLMKECEGNIEYSKNWYNFYCENVPISREYKCLGLGDDVDKKNNCILKGNNPTC